MTIKYSLSQRVYLLCLGLVLMFTSCDTEDNSPAAPSMTCVIDRVEWTAVAARAIVINNTLNIAGVSESDEVINIVVTGTTEGSYSLNPIFPNNIAYAETNDGSSVSFASDENVVNTNFGQVVISSIDMTNKTISGTFNTEVHRRSDGMVKTINAGAFENLSLEGTFPRTSFDLSATIDGSLFTANLVYGSSSSGSIIIVGSDALGEESVSFSIPDDITPGTYDLGTPGLSTYGAQYSINSTTVLSAETGTLTITEHEETDQIIKGTFSFEASALASANTASLIDGSFELTYN